MLIFHKIDEGGDCVANDNSLQVALDEILEDIRIIQEVLNHSKIILEINSPLIERYFFSNMLKKMVAIIEEQDNIIF